MALRGRNAPGLAGPAWVPCKTLTLQLRTIGPNEKKLMMEDVEDLATREYVREPPSMNYIAHVGDILSGGCPGQEVPNWTEMLWAAEEDIHGHDPAMEVTQMFDRLMAECDLARLSYFIRTEEGLRLKKYLKEAWVRVTLCMPASMYGLAEGENCLFAYSMEGLIIAQEHGRVGYRLRHNREMVDCLSEILNKMSHQAGELWIRILEDPSDSVADTDELDSSDLELVHFE